MNDITKVIQEIANLARLKPMQDSKKQIDDFNNLLHLFEQINTVNTDNVKVLKHPIDNACQPLREDQVTESDQHAYVQKLAPSVEAGVYLVPPAIEPKSE